MFCVSYKIRNTANPEKSLAKIRKQLFIIFNFGSYRWISNYGRRELDILLIVMDKNIANLCNNYPYIAFYIVYLYYVITISTKKIEYQNGLMLGRIFII